MMANEKYTPGVLFGTLIGFSLGAAAALLLAPKSGKELRRDIANQYQTVSDEAQELARRVGDKTSELVQRTKQTGSDIRSGVAEAVENFREAPAVADPSDADKNSQMKDD